MDYTGSGWGIMAGWVEHGREPWGTVERLLVCPGFCCVQSLG